MDNTTIAQVADLLTKGGPVIMLLICYIAMNAARTAKDAVKAITDIRDAVVNDIKPSLKAHDTLLQDIHESARAAEESSIANGQRLSAVIANQNAAK